jgi:hypothetical protein
VVPGDPQLSIWPDNGSPGTIVDVVGSSFPSRSQVQYHLGPSDTALELIGETWTEINGTFSTRITIPDSAAPGGTLVVVAETVEEPIVRASSVIFAVTDPDAPVTTNVDIYLVSLGEGDIGCGDDVSAINVEIPPTQAPLPAAINELLSMKDRIDPETGLYNSLYRSNLSIQSIEITSGNTSIQLSGDFLIDSDCDLPRVIAQIEQVALQFSEVTSVEVIINGSVIDG